ncbi:hypothetical protein [uncultured Erythrobacter sp.]|uniref:hypothetical protein n=1 Tax=uncultured Erythrobacter sp. TaxID=263913 RepID=UPI00261729B1|nr:hypothetical protein [uncultured Erythrobacter sp.]
MTPEALAKAEAQHERNRKKREEMIVYAIAAMTGSRIGLNAASPVLIRFVTQE